MDLLALLLALGLVFLNGFFVATEFAIVKVRPTRIEELTRRGNRPGAKAVKKILRNLDGYLSATQLGITLASLGLGWLGEPAFSRLLEGLLAAVGFDDPALAHQLALPFAFLVITYLHIVLGELAPKSLAILRAENVAMAVAWPMRAFHALFFPFTWLLNFQAGLVLRLFGLRTVEHGDIGQHSEEEIRIILSQARSAGLLSGERADILQKALSLPNKTVRHVMVPRNEVVYLDAGLPLDENLARAQASSHTRFPLCQGGLDDILGIVDIREVMFPLLARAQGETPTAEPEPVDLADYAQRPAYFPETMASERLLSEFRSRSTQMAVIVDEYGGTSGIVTAADVVTAVMGDLEEEEDSELVELPGGAYDVEGTTSLEELTGVLHIELKNVDMRTVAGFLMKRLGRMPQKGDRVTVSGYVFNVVEVQGPRVRKVRIQRESRVTRSGEARPTRPREAGKEPGKEPSKEHGKEASRDSPGKDVPKEPVKEVHREVEPPA